jgi:hypothetical protein
MAVVRLIPFSVKVEVEYVNDLMTFFSCIGYLCDAIFTSNFVLYISFDVKYALLEY